VWPNLCSHLARVINRVHIHMGNLSVLRLSPLFCSRWARRHTLSSRACATPSRAPSSSRGRTPTSSPRSRCIYRFLWTCRCSMYLSLSMHLYIYIYHPHQGSPPPRHRPDQGASIAFYGHVDIVCIYLYLCIYIYIYIILIKVAHHHVIAQIKVHLSLFMDM